MYKFVGVHFICRTNANIDLIVSGVELLNKLKQSPGGQENHNRLTSLADLQETFSYFFSRGRAAERIFTDAELYKQVVETVFSLGNIEVSSGSLSNSGFVCLFVL